MRAMFFGSASRAARAVLTASVSGSERYSTPAGDLYCTGGAPAWPAASEGAKAIVAAMMDVDAARWMFLNGMDPDSTPFPTSLYAKAPHQNEYGFADLTPALTGKSYTSPNGIALNATYINYLRRIAPRASRFRMSDGMKPIVVIANGVPIAVLMAMKQ